MHILLFPLGGAPVDGSQTDLGIGQLETIPDASGILELHNPTEQDWPWGSSFRLAIVHWRDGEGNPIVGGIGTATVYNVDGDAVPGLVDLEVSESAIIEGSYYVPIPASLSRIPGKGTSLTCEVILTSGDITTRLVALARVTN